MITGFKKLVPTFHRLRPTFGLAAEKACRPKSVLLAEDDESVRAFAALVIHALGYEVIQVGSAQEALKLRRDRPVDLLMTDLLMPAMSGKDLADRLWRRFPMQRVLFFSGYPERMARQRWNLDPGMAFLQKPFTSHALARKLTEILEEPADPSPLRSH